MTPREASRVREVLRELLGLGDLPQYGRSIIENLLKEMEAETPETEAKITRQEFGELSSEVEAVGKVAQAIEKARGRSAEETTKRLLTKIEKDARKRIPLGPAFGRGTPRRPREKDDPRLAEIGEKLMAKIQEAVKRRKGIRGGF